MSAESQPPTEFEPTHEPMVNVAPVHAAPGRFVLWATWLLGLGALGLIVVAATPAVARNLGVTHTQIVERDYQKTAPAGKAGVDAVDDYHKDISRSIDRLESMPDRTLPPMIGDDEDGPEPGGIQVAVTRDATKLRAAGNAKSPTIKTLPAGATLVVLSVRGGWVQVLYQDENDDIVTGFVTEKELGAPQ
ncbi:MAG: SH3 domain-containing protein [Polyangiaceae bacterium]